MSSVRIVRWPAEADRREELCRERRPRLLDVRVLRLRRRLAPLGLGTRTVRARGYALVVARNEG